ncbi:MAG TPA: hypothetical protein VHX19_19760 [Stellaceae bacterium]|jgi:hypothetical protein|nr:hypothetical protein [Stellaceae bacterium]
MKFHTPDNTDLIEVTAVRPHENGILIEGTIMGAMPMKAVLRPAELRRGFSLLGVRTIATLIAMLVRR